MTAAKEVSTVRFSVRDHKDGTADLLDNGVVIGTIEMDPMRLQASGHYSSLGYVVRGTTVEVDGVATGYVSIASGTNTTVKGVGRLRKVKALAARHLEAALTR